MIDLFGAAGVLPVDAGQFSDQCDGCAHNQLQPPPIQNVGSDPNQEPAKPRFENVATDPNQAPPPLK